MGRICSITAAILLLTVSWVSAGAFEVLAKADAVRTPKALHVAAPGAVVKAEFRSDGDDTLEMRTESDTLPVGTTAAAPLVKPKPVVAYKERSSRAMAPPPKAAPPREPAAATLAQSEEKDSLELDLEKDLVISPPPPKAEGAPAPITRPSVETRGVAVKETPREASREPKVSGVKPKAQVARPTAPRTEQYAQAIRKVRPITANPWMTPAGAHRAPAPACPPALTESYAPRDAYRMATPATTGRVVRDGVTVKLAPPPGAEAYPPANEEYDRSDIISAAVEIIGMPFAFISSIF